MSGVYSQRFMAGYLASGASLTYTVPDGQVAIVRDFSAWADAGSPGDALAYLILPNGSGPDALAVPPAGPKQAAYSNLRTVWYAGEVITVSAEMATNVYVGGYLFNA
jgi:hypothetical protein